PTASATYNVTGTDANGCSASDSMVVDVLTVHINQNDTTICEGDSLVLLANGFQTYSSGSNNSQLSGTLNNGLVGYWPFNGNANDESGNGNDGTVNGATLTTDRFGNLNSAYDFDGIDDYIQASNYSSNSSFTFSGWVNLSDYDIQAINNSCYDIAFFSNYSSIGKAIVVGWRKENNDTGFSTYLWNQSQNSTQYDHYPIDQASPSINNWHHLVSVFENGSAVKMYLNGELFYSSTSSRQGFSNPLLSNNTALSLNFGKWDENTCFTDGKLDDFGFWNRVLSVQEIQELYSYQSYTYNWSPTNETTSSINVQPTTTTTYTVDVTSGSTTCQSDVTISVNPKDDATFAYSASTYCSSDSDPSATISGTSGGIFTANSAGLNINSSTGLIDLDASNAGTYTVKYVTAGACPDSSTQDITIHTSPVVDLGLDVAICDGATQTLDAGSGASNYLWSTGATTQTIDVTTSGTYSVTASNPVTTSLNSSMDFDGMGSSQYGETNTAANVIFNGVNNFTVETWYKNPGVSTGANNNINNYGTIVTSYKTRSGGDPSDNFSLNVRSSSNSTNVGHAEFYVEGQSTPLISNNRVDDNQWHHIAAVYDYSNGTQYLYVDGVLNSTQSETGSGTLSTNNIRINRWSPYAGDFSYDCQVASVCISSGLKYTTDFTPCIQSTDANTLLLWKFQNVSGNTVSDESGNGYDLQLYNGPTSVSDAPSQTCTSCSATDDIVVTVSPQDDATFAYSASSYCSDDSDPTPTISGTAGGTFSSSTGLVMTNGVIDLDASPAGTYTIKYVTPGTCPDSSTQDVTITPTPTVNLGNDVAICQGDSTLLDAGSGHTNYLWNTGETTQTIYADTAGTYSVTVGNGTLVNNNYSMFFDDNNSGVDFGNSPNFDLEDTTTICFWAKDSSNRDIRRSLLYKGNCSSSYCTDLHIYSTSSTNPSINWTSGSSSNPCNAGNINLQVDSAWHFYSFVFIPDGSNSGVKKIYFDGALIDSCNYDDNASPNSYNLIAGDYNGTNSNPIAAVDYMDEIAIWNKEFNKSGIKFLMNNPPNGNEADLIGYWSFNEGSGTTTSDLTNNNHGTLFGGTLWSSDVPAQYTNNCTATDDVVVTVNPLPTIDLGADTTLICDGTIETLDAGTGFASYLWSDGSTNQTLLATTAGTYTVTGTDANGCAASDSMLVDILTASIVQNDTTICEGDSLFLGVDVSLSVGDNKAIDIDGNIYNYVSIGDQQWMSSNLRTSYYSNGDPIPLVTNSSSWSSLSSGAYCWYNNDSAAHHSDYGKLYNFHAASDVRNLCPTGWHVPSNDEWIELRDYLTANGHSGEEGKVLKANNGWNSGSGNDDFGFAALPGGYRSVGGPFSLKGSIFDVWGSENWFQIINNEISGPNSIGYQNYGFSVRCIKDADVGANSPNNTQFNWSPTNETTSSITVQPSATTTYTVDVTSGSTTCQSDVTITVNPKDDATFAYSNTTYCSIDSDPSATISGTSGGIFTANSAGLNINSSSGLIDLDASTAGTYTIKYVTTGTCPDSSSQDITIHTSPTVDLGNDTTICTGNTLTLDAGAGYTYLWSDASTNQTLDVTTFGIYDVTITDNNNCTATDQINVLFETLTVFAGNDQTLCDGGSVTLTRATSGTICATAPEGQPATLTAPAGAVFTSVVFASYGLPEGTCGSFTIGSCHSTTSQSVVEGLILGQNSVTIQAENGVFGDPCVGIGKKLSIEAQWSYSNSTTTFAWDNGVVDGVTFVPTTTTTYTVTGTNSNA
ncbi:MAG: hypothetical protein L7S72_04860, partial [Flavobacteriales bacterium]|nr:hypothetical protein [Flavobacteriales bacterium]